VNADPPCWGLTVIHSDVRGTKKAIDDTIYDAGASNLQSNHCDFPDFGVAYDINALDQKLEQAQLDQMIERAAELTGDANAIRSIRQFPIEEND
jgi:D-3-phosphoglycerate dehydrogenase